MGAVQSEYSNRLGRWIVAVIVILTVTTLVYANFDSPPIDFAPTYIAASFYDDGLAHLVYPRDGDFFWNTIPQEWQDQADLHSNGLHIVTPYVYPPIWVAVFAPLTNLVSLDVFARLLLLINAGSFIGMIGLGYRMLKPRCVSAIEWSLMLAILLLTSSVPNLSLGLGQPQILVTFLIMLAFTNLVEDNPVGAGGWLALAAAIKMSPALLVCIFVMERNWRAVMWFGVFGGLLGGLSVLATGWPLHAEFLEKLRELEGTILVSRINLGMDLPLLLLSKAYYGTLSLETLRIDLWNEPTWVGWTVRAALVSGLSACFLVTRNLDARERVWARLLSVSLLLVMVSPLGWIHYLVLPMMLLPGLLDVSSRRWGAFVFGLVVIGYSLPLYIALADHSETFVAQVFLHFMLVASLFVSVLIVCARRLRKAKP